MEAVLDYVTAGAVTTSAARRTRRDLQHRTIALLKAYDASVGATPRHRDVAERAWPAVVAAQRLTYRLLSVCWSLENAGADAAVATLSDAIRSGTKPAPLSHLPEFLNTEMRNLYDSLVYDGNPVAR